MKIDEIESNLNAEPLIRWEECDEKPGEIVFGYLPGAINVSLHINLMTPQPWMLCGYENKINKWFFHTPEKMYLDPNNDDLKFEDLRERKKICRIARACTSRSTREISARRGDRLSN